MHLFRRSPEPVYHGYEVQMFSCMKCDAEITRSADRKGKPHPQAVFDRTGDANKLVISANNAKLFQQKGSFRAATTSVGHSPMIVGEKGILCEED